jgi:hypothetical protein
MSTCETITEAWQVFHNPRTEFGCFVYRDRAGWVWIHPIHGCEPARDENNRLITYQYSSEYMALLRVAHVYEWGE